MPVDIQLLSDSPIITATLYAPFDMKEDGAYLFQELINIRDTIEGFDRYFVVLDVRNIKFSFGDVVIFLGESKIARQQRRDDMPVTLSLVGRGKMIEMAGRAMGQQQYGGYKMGIFTALEEALDAIYASLAQA